MNDAGSSKRWKLPLEFLAIIGFLAVWFVLQIFVLPKTGVRT
jgi:hypothetical protein